MSVFLPREDMMELFLKVTINGVVLNNRLIESVEVEESDSEADLGRVTLADPDLIALNDVSLTKKAPIEIDMGFKKEHRVMLKGEVTHLEPEFGEDGIPRLVIGAIDKTSGMASKKKTRKWKKKKVSEVVLGIAKEYGYTPDVKDTGEVVDEITQDDETDAQLLARLADNEAFHWYLIEDEKKMFFGERVNSNLAVVDTFSYKTGNKAIISFSPNFVEKNKEVKGDSNNVDAKTGENKKTPSGQTKAPVKSSQVSSPKSVLVVDGRNGSVVR